MKSPLKGGIEMKPCVLCVFICFAGVFGSLDIAAASPVGGQVEDFTLRSHRGREFSLSDFSEDKLVVVAFLGTECPLAKLYGPRLAELSDQFKQKSVAFIGINDHFIARDQ